MSSLFHYITNSTTAIGRSLCKRTTIRSFHSPFAVLGQTPRKVQSQQPNPFSVYEKQCDISHEPFTSTSGNRTYVVSQPDASASHYQVPSGAYPTSSPYVNFTASEAPGKKGAQVSSTSSGLAHPVTTRAVPQHFGGVGSSSAIRNATAPGEMDEQGGSYGGVGMMDKEQVTPGEGELAERNPPPDSEVAETFSKAGLRGAWKLRK